MVSEENKPLTDAQESKPQKSYAVRPERERHRIAFSDRDNMFKVRNTLNIIFMLLAIIGVIMWSQMADHTAAIIVLLTGVTLKIAEVCIRLFHK